jgi:hypothetical protein
MPHGVTDAGCPLIHAASRRLNGDEVVLSGVTNKGENECHLVLRKFNIKLKTLKFLF